MRTRTIKTRWNECENYLHIIHIIFVLYTSLSRWILIFRKKDLFESLETWDLNLSWVNWNRVFLYQFAVIAPAQSQMDVFLRAETNKGPPLKPIRRSHVTRVCLCHVFSSTLRVIFAGTGILKMDSLFVRTLLSNRPFSKYQIFSLIVRQWGQNNRNTLEWMWKIFKYHPVSFVFVLAPSLSSWILIYRKRAYSHLTLSIWSHRATWWYLCGFARLPCRSLLSDLNDLNLNEVNQLSPSRSFQHS